MAANMWTLTWDLVQKFWKWWFKFITQHKICRFFQQENNCKKSLLNPIGFHCRKQFCLNNLLFVTKYWEYSTQFIHMSKYHSSNMVRSNLWSEDFGSHYLCWSYVLLVANKCCYILHLSYTENVQKKLTETENILLNKRYTNWYGHRNYMKMINEMIRKFSKIIVTTLYGNDNINIKMIFWNILKK